MEVNRLEFSYIITDQTVVHYNPLRKGKATTVSDLRASAANRKLQGTPDARNKPLLQVKHYEQLQSARKFDARQILDDELICPESDLSYAAAIALAEEEKRTEATQHSYEGLKNTAVATMCAVITTACLHYVWPS